MGHEIKANKSSLFRQIGYSPQEDPLWPVITLQEHLQCYAQLRGIPQSNIDTIIQR